MFAGSGIRDKRMAAAALRSGALAALLLAAQIMPPLRSGRGFQRLNGSPEKSED